MKPILRQTGPLGTPPRGFTLIELLVTISIIAVIAGIGVVVGGQMQRSAAESQTRTLLGQLATTAIEYKEQAGNDFTWVRTTIPVVVFGTPYNSSDATMDYESINRYVSAVRANARPAVEQLRSVNNRLFAGSVFDEGAASTQAAASQNGTSIVDAFDNPIRYYPGTDNRAPSAPSLTSIPAINRDNGMPLRKRPYFASAGQDGQWGTIDDQNEPDDNAQDNLYSFEVR